MCQHPQRMSKMHWDTVGTPRRLASMCSISTAINDLPRRVHVSFPRSFSTCPRHPSGAPQSPHWHVARAADCEAFGGNARCADTRRPCRSGQPPAARCRTSTMGRSLSALGSKGHCPKAEDDAAGCPVNRNREGAPPTPCPALRGRSTRRGGPTCNQALHKTLGILVPASSDFRRKSTQAIGAAASQLRVTGAMCRCKCRLRDAQAPQLRGCHRIGWATPGWHQSIALASCFTPINDEVEAAASRGEPVG